MAVISGPVAVSSHTLQICSRCVSSKQGTGAIGIVTQSIRGHWTKPAPLHPKGSAPGFVVRAGRQPRFFICTFAQLVYASRGNPKSIPSRCTKSLRFDLSKAHKRQLFLVLSG